MPTTEPTRGEPRIVESGTEARQGATGHNVRWVLAVGLFGTLAVLMIAALVFILGSPG